MQTRVLHQKKRLGATFLSRRTLRTRVISASHFLAVPQPVSTTGKATTASRASQICRRSSSSSATIRFLRRPPWRGGWSGTEPRWDCRNRPQRTESA